MKKTIAMTRETKRYFFEKINKLDKPLAKLIKGKKKEELKNNIRNEKEEIKANTEIQRIIRDY